MKKFFLSETWTIGMAMFAMFFGAGNIIFPLALGQFAGEKTFFAILGLIITAALMPIMGIVAMILFQGSYKDFFGRLGKAPGFFIALLIILLLGPLGSTPRCISLAYSTLSLFFPKISPFAFYGASCGVIFLCCIKKNKILPLLGLVLTPFLLISLLSIIMIGLFSPHEPILNDSPPLMMFFHGLKEGYNTMDLLASFFFSSTILQLVHLKKKEETPTGALLLVLRASLIGIFLLSAIYIGFSYLAAFHSQNMGGLGKDQLLAALTIKIAGPYAGLLVCSAIGLACLTTAIALICAFTDFIQTEVFASKVSYSTLLGFSLILTFVVSCFQFQGISAFLSPILEMCYPGLIVLTLLNIAYRIKHFEPIKAPVFVTFLLTALRHVL